MAFQVDWTEQASRSMESIWQYIVADNPAAADRVIEAIVRQTELLATAPRLGPRYSYQGVGEIRQTISGRYRVFYLVDEADQRVDILEVWHSSRQEPEL